MAAFSASFWLRHSAKAILFLMYSSWCSACHLHSAMRLSRTQCGSGHMPEMLHGFLQQILGARYLADNQLERIVSIIIVILGANSLMLHQLSFVLSHRRWLDALTYT